MAIQRPVPDVEAPTITAEGFLPVEIDVDLPPPVTSAVPVSPNQMLAANCVDIIMSDEARSLIIGPTVLSAMLDPLQ